MPRLDTAVPDADTATALLALARAIEGEDGAPPLSDQTLTHLRSPEVEHVVVRADQDDVIGYAQRDDDSVELTGEPSAIQTLLDAVTASGRLVWSHGRRSRVVTDFESRHFARARELHQLRRPLGDDLPTDPQLPGDLAVRAFIPGRDDTAWLELNAAAFAHHPEQGSMAQADLDARMSEEWFDADGFLLAERDHQLVAFHWTKTHPDGLGEVYVLGVAPDAQGLGLGGALLIRGLRHLKTVGCTSVLLYVDGDNPGALHLYERDGFVRHDLDVQWRMP